MIFEVPRLKKSLLITVDTSKDGINNFPDFCGETISFFRVNIYIKLNSKERLNIVKTDIASIIHFVWLKQFNIHFNYHKICIWCSSSFIASIHFSPWFFDIYFSLSRSPCKFHLFKSSLKFFLGPFLLAFPVSYCLV